MRVQKIVRNRAQCKHCLGIVESKSIHDFVWCPCGKIFVDGGLEYLRRGHPEGPVENHLVELSEYGGEFLR